MKIHCIVIYIISTFICYSDITVESHTLNTKDSKLWSVTFSVYNNSDSQVIVNTGYLQHGVVDADKNNSTFVVLTQLEGVSINNQSYTKVPPINDLKLVTLKKNQFTKIVYKFAPDEEDIKMLSQIKSGKEFKLVYSSKDRNFGYTYWIGKITSSNAIKLQQEVK